MTFTAALEPIATYAPLAPLRALYPKLGFAGTVVNQWSSFLTFSAINPAG